jgi:Flp pilus assembly protein TadD
MACHNPCSMYRPIASCVCALYVACAWAADLPSKITSDADANTAFKKGADLISPHMGLLGRSPGKTQSAREDLTLGIAYMQAVTHYKPQNWAAFWIEGKAYQALNQHAAAYGAFRSAYALQRENADVARELAESCLELGRNEEAVDVTRHAIALAPNDAGLRANLALAYLLAADSQSAQRAVNESLTMNPNDKITVRLKAFIDDVAAGKRAQPRTMADLQK